VHMNRSKPAKCGKMRVLEDPSIFAKYIRHHFYTKDSDWDRDSWTVQLFEEIIHIDAASPKKDGPMQLARRQLLPQASVPVKAAEWSRQFEARGKKGWNIPNKVLWLEQWLKADSLDLNFDWLKLYMMCDLMWFFADETLKQIPGFRNEYLQPNDPGPHEAISVQVLKNTIEGKGTSISVMAMMIGEFVTLSCPAPEGNPYIS
jgi:hypothetical protein